MRHQYICSKIKSRFNALGFLDKTVWREIKAVDLVNNDGTKLSKEYSTKAQICWDNENLYIRFNCNDSYIWATMKESVQPLWEEEVVEVFIDPDKDGKNYVEVEVNPLNNTLTLLIPGKEQKSNWRDNAKFQLKNLKTKAVKSSHNWLTDIIIPFENFSRQVNIPPRNGDIWHLNLYRVERPVKERPRDCVLIAWSPTFKDTFHSPPHFGEIVFMDF